MNTRNADFTDSSNCEHINNFPNIEAIWQEQYEFIDFDKLSLTKVREFGGYSKGEIMNWINSTIPSTYDGYITYMWPGWCTATLHGTRLSELSSGDAKPYSRIVLTPTKIQYYANTSPSYPASSLVQEWDR